MLQAILVLLVLLVAGGAFVVWRSLEGGVQTATVYETNVTVTPQRDVVEPVLEEIVQGDTSSEQAAVPQFDLPAVAREVQDAIQAKEEVPDSSVFE